MKTLTFFFAALSLFVSPCTSAEPDKASKNIPLKYVEAATAYSLLKSQFPDISATVIAIRTDSNMLTVKLNSPRLEDVREMIAIIDSRPKQVCLQAEIVEINADGDEKVISRPTVYAIEGRPAEISFGHHDGKTIRITLTATSVLDSAK